MRSEYIRSTHPAEPPVPKLRLLGTSWYRRGVGYWVRRASLTVEYLLLLGLVGLFARSVIDAAATGMTGTGRLVVLALIGTVILGSYVQPVRASLRRR
ncbi:MAG: hypothetical protein H7146_09205, partial [Burkholderiaceae bacterium]|nr:hypothetical protein [Microbacteriaceae bacterium]